MNVGQKLSPKRVALIGSRKAPRHICVFAKALGRAFSNLGWIGYSGGAAGMDDAWMADYDRSLSRIIIPWEGFNGHYTSPGYYCWRKQPNDVKIRSICHAMSVTPYFENVGRGPQNLFSRNSLQVLDLDCINPVDEIYYWAPEIKGKVSGGTRIAIDIGRKFGIKTYNLYFEDTLKHLEEKYCPKNDLDWLL